LAHDWLYHLHSQCFPIPIEQFNAIHYAGTAVYKIGVLLFNRGAVRGARDRVTKG